MFKGIPVRVWLVVSLCVVSCSVFGFIIGDNHTQIANVFKPTAIPTFVPTIDNPFDFDIPPLVAPHTDTIYPYCDTTNLTERYRDYLDQWKKSDTANELYRELDAFEIPIEILNQCGEHQAMLIKMLEDTARVGIPSSDSGFADVISYKQAVLLRIRRLEYFDLSGW
jgi:hypothetical protein